MTKNCLSSIDTSHFVLKTKYNTGKTELEQKIPDTSDLVKKIAMQKLLRQRVKFLILLTQQQKLH